MASRKLQIGFLTNPRKQIPRSVRPALKQTRSTRSKIRCLQLLRARDWNGNNPQHTIIDILTYRHTSLRSRNRANEPNHDNVCTRYWLFGDLATGAYDAPGCALRGGCWACETGCSQGCWPPACYLTRHSPAALEPRLRGFVSNCATNWMPAITHMCKHDRNMSRHIEMDAQRPKQ